MENKNLVRSVTCAWNTNEIHKLIYNTYLFCNNNIASRVDGLHNISIIIEQLQLTALQSIKVDRLSIRDQLKVTLRDKYIE